MADIPDGFHCERWRYAGKRLNEKHVLLEVWTPEDNLENERWINTTVNGPIGAVYNIVCKLGDDGHYNLFTKGVYGPQFLEASPDDEICRSWRAADRAARVRHAQLGMERRARVEEDDVSRALAVLQREYYSLRTWTEHAAWLAYVTQQITASPVPAAAKQKDTINGRATRKRRTG